METNSIKDSVRKRYGSVASQARARSGCGCPAQEPREACLTPEAISEQIGYSSSKISGVPEGANLGLGCGNPTALAAIAEGETILDLGSGAGFDCFLAARKVGPSGRVIGVDMTPEMVSKAKENSAKSGIDNVEFRLGEIEELPVDSESIDKIISNCVINLSPDKDKVFAEAFRVLKPGGKMMISDLVLATDLPGPLKESISAHVNCIAGSLKKTDYLKKIRNAGFREVEIVQETPYPALFTASDPLIKTVLEESGLSLETLAEAAKTVFSVRVSATKP